MVEEVDAVLQSTAAATCPGQASHPASPSRHLAGVTPMNADSGPVRGQRHVRGGRAPARKALSMAALCSTLHNPPLKAYTSA